jgi:hypothetical protein
MYQSNCGNSHGDISLIYESPWTYAVRINRGCLRRRWLPVKQLIAPEKLSRWRFRVESYLNAHQIREMVQPSCFFHACGRNVQ